MPGLLAEAAEVVAEAARLATAAAVAAAAADHAGQQAVAGVAVAQRPVHERLELQTVRLQGGDLGEAELAGQDGPREAEPRQGRQLRRAVRAELGAGVQRQLRVFLAHAPGEAEVGDDERVEAGDVRRLQRRQRRLHLRVLEQCVQRHVRASTVEMRQLHGRHGRVAGEVAGEGARTPAFEAEVDGIGAGRKGRAQSARLPGRRQKLGAGR